MISAKLMEDLKKEGFSLQFPSLDSNEYKIISIIKEQNERLNLAIPLLLKKEFDYKLIIKKIGLLQKHHFNHLILITQKIFRLEQIDDKHLKEIIRKYELKSKISKTELDYYYNSFKESMQNLERKKEEKLKKQIKLRTALTTNQALSEIFSPAKIRIMRNIFAHGTLTNTELKYYYRAIKPLISAISSKDMQNYLKLIESIKKNY